MCILIRAWVMELPCAETLSITGGMCYLHEVPLIAHMWVTGSNSSGRLRRRVTEHGASSAGQVRACGGAQGGYNPEGRPCER